MQHGQARGATRTAGDKRSNQADQQSPSACKHHVLHVQTSLHPAGRGQLLQWTLFRKRKALQKTARYIPQPVDTMRVKRLS